MVFNLLYGDIYNIIKDDNYQNILHIKNIKNITIQMLIALNNLHNTHNIIHSDIKPENILLSGVNNKIKI